MSRIHIVKDGDRLILISQKYYGTGSKWKKIVNANSQLNGRKTAIDGSPLIYKGDTLIIPDDVQQEKIKKIIPTIDVDDENRLTLKVDGKKYEFFSDFTLEQPIDSVDTFRVSAPFNPVDPVYRESFRPFSYKPCEIYYGSNLRFNGVLLAPQSESSPKSKAMTVSGYAKCGILNDISLSISKYPIEFNNQNLKQIADMLTSDNGLSPVFDSNPGNPFKKVSLEPDKKIMSFLVNLAQERGLLISNDANGDPLFWQANTDDDIVATFTEGETPYISCVPNFNPQQFYSHITGIMNAKSGKSSEKHTVVNNYLVNLGIARHYNYTINNAEKSDLQASVKAKAGRMFGDSCSYILTVQGHRDKNGNLYEKNTTVSVLAPGAMIYKDTKFLVKKITQTRSSKTGDTTVFDLCLPESYSGEIPDSFPWEEEQIILDLRG